MPATAILREVENLYSVCDRLDSMAEDHLPIVADALITLSGNVRNTATLLEVLVATKLSPLTGLDPTVS